MILFTYFDGATGPVRLAGWTNYSEAYAEAELRAQARREAGDPAPSDASLTELRLMRWQRLCDAMRAAVEGGRV